MSDGEDARGLLADGVLDPDVLGAGADGREAWALLSGSEGRLGAALSVFGGVLAAGGAALVFGAVLVRGPGLVLVAPAAGAVLARPMLPTGTEGELVPLVFGGVLVDGEGGALEGSGSSPQASSRSSSVSLMPA